MSININAKDIENLFYEQQRCYFLTCTAGFNLLLNKLKKKHKLSILKTRRDWDIFFLSSDYSGSAFLKEFRAIMVLIQTNKYFLENALVGVYKNNIPSTDSSLPFHVGYEGESLGDGFFIKISPKTRKETVVRSYKGAIDIYNDMNKFESYTGKKIIVSRRDKKIDLDKHLSIFLTTERIILETYKLADAELSMKQIGAASTDIVAIKTAIIQDLYKNNEEVIKDKDKRIALLEKELSNSKMSALPSEAIQSGLKVILPSLIHMFIYKNVNPGSSNKLLVAYLQTNTKLTKVEEDRAREWLRVRTQAEVVKLFYEKVKKPLIQASVKP